MSTNEPNPPTDTPAATSYAEGQTLAGCYALSRRLGTVDGVEIWLANDEVLGKEVTLHILPAAVAKDSRAMQELRQEVKRGRQLIHAHVVRVYDLIEEPELTAISMNAFEGESVAQRAAKQAGRPFAVGEIEPWMFPLAQTIEDAHKLNFLHRDLAPQNLFVNATGQLLVANFAISRIVQDALGRAGGANPTRSAFASPQTLEGNAPARTDDVYSLGAILYTLLVGAPPAAGADVAALDKPELNIPAAWRQTIAASLQKSPADRPQTAGEFLKRLKGEAGAPAPVAAPAGEKAPAPAEAPQVKAEPAAKMEAVAKSEPAQRAVEKAEPVKEPKPKAESKPERKAEPKSEPKPEPKPEQKSEPKPEKKSEPKPELKSEPKSEPKRVSEILPPIRTEPRKTLERPSVGDFKPRLYAEESRFPIVAVGLGAILLLGALILYFSRPGKKTVEPEVGVETPTAVTPAPEDEEKKPAAGTPAIVTKEHATPQGTTAGQTPGPKSTPPVAIEGERELAGKRAALEKTKQSVQAAEKRRIDLVKLQQQTDSAAVESRKAVEEKTKANESIKKAATEASARKKKLEEDQKAAETAAETAQKMAEEKERLAEESRKKFEDFEKENEEKQAAQEKANAEFETLQKTLAEKQKAADEAAKAAADAETARAQQAAALARSEREVEDAQAAIDLEKSLKNKLDQLRNFSVASATPSPTVALATPPFPAATPRLAAATPQPPVVTPLPVATPLPPTVTPRPAVTPAPTATPQPPAVTPRTAVTPLPTATPQTVATPLPAATPPPPVATPAPTATPRPPVATPPPAATPQPPAATSPSPAATPSTSPAAPTPLKAFTPSPTKLALLTTPAASTPMQATPAPSTPAVSHTAGTGGGNSLGMRFLPVGDVDFCIWLTRVKDFDAFAKAVNLKSTSWQSPGFRQGADHPVVNVTWQEAVAFCQWLTAKEHKEGVLPANQFYRLPEDLEWSKAVGLPEETGKTPEARDMDIPEVYPWGTSWPPTAGAGNYTGEETGSDVAIKGYDDGFAWTSPVGSFKANQHGLYDMGGNVWQWCMDNWNDESKAKVLRGASWYNGALKLSLLSSCRVHAAPESSTDNYGFRIVRASEASSGLKNKFR